MPKENVRRGRARTSPPRSARSERQALLGQQKSLSEFGEKALKLDDLDFLLHESCRLVGEALGTDLAKVITLEADGTAIFVRAGVGWSPGVVGEVTVPLEEDTADRFAITRRKPVIVANVDEEKRFRIAGFVLEEGVKAFVNTPIIGDDSHPPLGILEVDSKTPRRFTEEDIAFLKTYANMIAAAIGRLRSSEALRGLADQRMHLLNELQHRLKNNLQAVSAFIGMALRSPGGDAAKNVLASLAARIDALKLVQEKIYASGKFDRVELASYLSELTAGLLRFHQTDLARIGLKSDLMPLIIPPDVAVPLGLIVTEFITNSMKYAFEGDGVISLQLKTVADRGWLVLADNGRGLGQRRSEGTGMKVIRGLADQLHAEIEWSGDAGTRLSIRFPLVNFEEGLSRI